MVVLLSRPPHLATCLDHDAGFRSRFASRRSANGIEQLACFRRFQQIVLESQSRGARDVAGVRFGGVGDCGRPSHVAHVLLVIAQNVFAADTHLGYQNVGTMSLYRRRDILQRADDLAQDNPLARFQREADSIAYDRVVVDQNDSHSHDVHPHQWPQHLNRNVPGCRNALTQSH